MGDINMKTKKLVCGIGLNDADYVVVKREEIGRIDGKRKQRQVWMCDYYQTWVDMLKRCYSTKKQEKHPTYAGCTVATEWLTFSKFKTWMESQDWVGLQLDKDLLFQGNKIYSPDTCVFVSQTVNKFANDHGASRGEWKIGATWNKEKGKFQSQCSNPFTKKRGHLGYFDSEQEAHQAWLKRKLELAKELAAIQTDPRVAKALILKYTNYKQASMGN
ncbi:MAG TPA: hypothetical protein VFD12_10930 [Oligella sp.]|nr:hypothetical protein [Oligella sp.]